MNLHRSLSRSKIVAICATLIALPACDQWVTPNAEETTLPDGGSSIVRIAPPIPGGGTPEATLELVDGTTCEVLLSEVEDGIVRAWATLDGGPLRTITVRGTNPPAGWKGFRATISTGSELFGYQLEFRTGNESYDAVIKEFTNDQELVITRELTGGGASIVESYSGSECGGEQSAEMVIFDKIPQTPPTIGFDEADLVAMAPEVFDNALGEQLMLVLGSPEFVEWLGDRIQTELGAQANNCGGDCCPWWLSNGATICGALKCTFGGGWLNPLCHVCTGTALGCAVAEFGCWLSDC